MVNAFAPVLDGCLATDSVCRHSHLLGLSSPDVVVSRSSGHADRRHLGIDEFGVRAPILPLVGTVFRSPPTSILPRGGIVATTEPGATVADGGEPCAGSRGLGPVGVCAEPRSASGALLVTSRPTHSGGGTTGASIAIAGAHAGGNA